MLVKEKDVIIDTIKTCSYNELLRYESAIAKEINKRDKEAKQLALEKLVDAFDDVQNVLSGELFYNTEGGFRFNFEDAYECIANKLAELS